MEKFSRFFMPSACLLMLSACGAGGGGDAQPAAISQTPTGATATPVTIAQPDPAPAMAPDPVSGTMTPDAVAEAAAGLDGWKPMTQIALKLRQQNSNAGWSYAVMADGARRYEVRSGDHWSGDSATGAERSESYDPYKVIVGKTYQVAFKMMIEPGETNKASWLLITQFTSELDPGEAAHSPPLALELAGDRFRVATRDSSAALSTAADIRYVRQFDETEPMTRGKWYDFKMQILFGPFGNSRLKVWRDDKQLVDFIGALGFNDIVGPYFKQGIYRSATGQGIAVQFKDLQFGMVD